MKKQVSFLFIVLLLLTNSFLAVGQSTGIMPRMMDRWGYNNNPYFAPLTPPDTNLLDLAGKGVGGVAFAGTAVPAGNAVGKQVSLQYDSAKPDGSRLSVIIGSDTINSGLYDWEWVPLVRFANGNSWACVSLIGGPNENDSEEVFKNLLKMCDLEFDNFTAFRSYAIKSEASRVKEIELEEMRKARNTSAVLRLNRELQALEKELDDIIEGMNLNDTISLLLYEMSSVMWASYNPAMGNSLVGLALLLVDAMFVSNDDGEPSISEIVSLTDSFPRINGFNTQRALQGTPSSALISALKGESLGEWHTYIFSDDGIPITYQVNSGRIEFTGFPYYQFMRGNDNGEYEYVTQLNEYMRNNNSAVKSLNPVLYNAAEKWCRWSALFRAVKANNSQSWNGFFATVNRAYPYSLENPERTRHPEPSYKTPRFWIR